MITGCNHKKTYRLEDEIKTKGKTLNDMQVMLIYFNRIVLRRGECENICTKILIFRNSYVSGLFVKMSTVHKTTEKIGT